ncbi:hypothetical protein K440DRAFT_304896 [Wilcoxina mikolae CBS 423.85]|nr:hypothetical protein K440DRAFT_304896 [Wilcoxina mikolae CBS 423.85]
MPAEWLQHAALPICIRLILFAVSSEFLTPRNTISAVSRKLHAYMTFTSRPTYSLPDRSSPNYPGNPLKIALISIGRSYELPLPVCTPVPFNQSSPSSKDFYRIKRILVGTFGPFDFRSV